MFEAKGVANFGTRCRGFEGPL